MYLAAKIGESEPQREKLARSLLRLGHVCLTSQYAAYNMHFKMKGYSMM